MDRTGPFTLRHEIELEQLLDRRGQTTELFLRLARQVQRKLVEATNDGRGYRAVVEMRMTILVDPTQARMGECVSHEDLRECYSHTLSDTSGVGHVYSERMP